MLQKSTISSHSLNDHIERKFAPLASSKTQQTHLSVEKMCWLMFNPEATFLPKPGLNFHVLLWEYYS